jgi:hypothetical protein
VFHKTPATPEYIREYPPFTDHLFLGLLNNKAKEANLQEPFINVRETPEDNGEVFLSEYFREQVQRNKEEQTDPNIRRCLCKDCSKNPLPYLNEEIGICEEPPTAPIVKARMARVRRPARARTRAANQQQNTEEQQ